MKPKDSRNDSWEESENGQDAVWQALGKASPAKASGRFADDVVRSVRLLPEREPIWVKFLKFSPVAGLTACAAVVLAVFLSQLSDEAVKTTSAGELAQQQAQEVRWEQIEEVAEVEILVAAADHLDDFTDQELFHLIGL